MSDSAKPFLTASALLFGVAAVYLGASQRDRADLGGAAAPVTMVGLRADRSQSVDIPISEYFTALSAKLQEEFVEPGIDEQKLAAGAVRGMVASLGDPASLYYEVEEFKALSDERDGKYHGIGVSLALAMDGPLTTKVIAAGEQDEAAAKATTGSATIPKLVVRTVVPDSPADKAGLKVGDIITSVDGHWIVDSDLLVKFQALGRRVIAKQAPASELIAMRKLLRMKLEKSLLPLKAREKLVLGDSGEVNLAYRRGQEETEVRLTKQPSSLQTLSQSGEVIKLTLTAGGVSRLREALASASKVTLDLTVNPAPMDGHLVEYLSILAPKGTYGAIQNEKGESSPVKVANGREKPLDLTLIVGPGTRGAARNLADALNSYGLAKIQGTLPKPEAYAKEIALPSGDGYTLAVGTYRAKPDKESVTALKQVGGSL